MPFSVDDFAEHAGVSVEILETLSSALPTGDGRLYNRWTARKKHGGIREIFKPNPPYDAVTKNLHRSFTDLVALQRHPTMFTDLFADAQRSAMRANTSGKRAYCALTLKTSFRRLAPQR